MRTFQLILATDFIRTHAFYLYDGSDSTNASTCQQQIYRVVMGYDAKDLQNYFNRNLHPNQLLLLHNMPGNTGRNGDWQFDFTLPPHQWSAEKKCRSWGVRERRRPLGTANLVEVQSCPCTRQQILNDRRFWFGYYSGLSSSPNCATFLLSRSQHTFECCYDESGALLLGAAERGGTLKRFNSLFFYDRYVREDLRPYEDCCINSNSSCSIYYEFRGSVDCSDYDPPSPCK